MPVPHTRPRLVMAVLSAMLLASCNALPPPHSLAQDSEPQPTRMLFDWPNKTVTIADTSYVLEDCSTETVNCALLRGQWMLAFPKYCARGDYSLALGDTQFMMIMPALHFGPPSGSYRASTYPDIVIRYYKTAGVTAIARVRQDMPVQYSYGANIAERFSVETRDGSPLFPCVDR